MNINPPAATTSQPHIERERPLRAALPLKNLSNVAAGPEAALPYYHVHSGFEFRIQRVDASIPPPKIYRGYDRVSRTLRRIASATYYGCKKEFGCNPVEVQVSMLAGELHISSNFHSDKLAPALAYMLSPQTELPPVAASKPAAARHIRHIHALRQLLSDAEAFEASLRKGCQEIESQTHSVARTNLAAQELINQFVPQMRGLRNSLLRCANGDTPAVVVHQSHNDMPPAGATSAIRHAERNITAHLARQASAIYERSLQMFGLTEGKHVIVPMEGRFVPCGFCHEQEAFEQRPGAQGLFDQAGKRYILHRSGNRVGKFYTGEVQYFSFDSLHPDADEAIRRAQWIIDAIQSGSDELSSHSRPLVAESAFNTDSEDSATEEDPLA